VTADPSTEVTTFDSSVTPTFTHANFTPTEFAKHASTADPICVGGFGLVRNTGDIYYFYELTLKGGVHPGTNPTCKNSNIGALFGTYVVSFVTIMNTTVVTFSSPTGTFGSANTFGQFVIGVLPLPHDKAYFGGISPAGTSTSTSYSLNKTAMDAVMQAWGVEKF
jgi:hypothetical protein